MEGKKMRKKGFTLVELLVVIAIIAMLLAILMPALSKVKTIAQRLMCGANIGGIGKAMLTYTNDDRYESYPVAGPGGTIWDRGRGTMSTGATEGECTWEWDKKAAPCDGCSGTNTNPCSTDCKSTISACLYLIVKYADTGVEQFICPSGVGEKAFEVELYNITTNDPEYGTSITDFWDFGSRSDAKDITLYRSLRPGRGHNSYSYQFPLPIATSGNGSTAYPPRAGSDPALAIVADRNPWWDVVGANNQNAETFAPSTWWDTSTKSIKSAYIPLLLNTFNHSREGQNVLFGDQHVRFEKSPNCGIDKDNIYLTWGKTGIELSNSSTIDMDRQLSGIAIRPLPGGTGKESYPQDEDDNYLVNDWN